MAEAEEAALSAARLEAALERIAKAGALGVHAGGGEDGATDTAEIAARLDTLIATVKRALARLNT